MEIASEVFVRRYPTIEIIVVDNNSGDRTEEISANFTDKVYNAGPERSAQRNHGLLNIAVDKYRAYFDADMLLTPRDIQGCGILKRLKNWAFVRFRAGKHDEYPIDARRSNWTTCMDPNHFERLWTDCGWKRNFNRS